MHIYLLCSAALLFIVCFPILQLRQVCIHLGAAAVEAMVEEVVEQIISSAVENAVESAVESEVEEIVEETVEQTVQETVQVNYLTFTVRFVTNNI